MQLTIMAVNEIHEKNNSGLTSAENLSDNVHDIKLYLDENFSNLPEKGEVTPQELMTLINSVITSMDSIVDDLRDANRWSSAILKIKE